MTKLRLRYLTGLRTGQELSASGSRVRIGRSRDNDIILHETTSPLSSAHHAEVRFEGGHWWLVDLASTNHTFLNGSSVQRARLSTGDQITVGSDVLAVYISNRRVALIASGASLLALVAIVSALALGSRRAPFEDVAAAAPQSVYLIAVDDGGRRSVTGTAFAIDEPQALLATNAHVANELLRRDSINAASASRAVAVRSDQRQALRIARLWLHPAWRKGSLDHDVALLQLDGRPALSALQLADSASVDRLRRGLPLASFGFPAASTDPLHPRGRLAVDVVGDVRLPFVEVGLAIAPGTSGSPVFDQSGTVVGVVVGGDFIDARDGRGNRPSGTEVNWVIVATAVRELLELPR